MKRKSNPGRAQVQRSKYQNEQEGEWAEVVDYDMIGGNKLRWQAEKFSVSLE